MLTLKYTQLCVWICNNENGEEKIMRESEMGKSEIIAQYNFISGIFSPFVEI